VIRNRSRNVHHESAPVSKSLTLSREIQKRKLTPAGTIDVIKHDQPQSASVPFGFASTLAAARAIAASNRAYWRMLFKMYGWGRAA
jgi:hypothetical protein